jgi:hypothetical protein
MMNRRRDTRITSENSRNLPNKKLPVMEAMITPNWHQAGVFPLRAVLLRGRMRTAAVEGDGVRRLR